MRGLALFLYGTKNLIASLLGLGALAAFFAGAIHEFWFEIVAAAYAIGYIGAPGNNRLDTTLGNELDAAGMQRDLQRLVAEVTPKVTPDVAALVASIAASIETVLPLLARSSGIADADAYTLRHAAIDYLPQTLAAYVKLPPAYRNTFPVDGGKTPRALMVEQLTLLDAKLKEIVANLLAGDTQALLANGRFLRERFAAAPAL